MRDRAAEDDEILELRTFAAIPATGPDLGHLKADPFGHTADDQGMVRDREEVVVR